MSVQGVKRSSPGAEEEKNPFGSVELTDEDAKKLQIVQKDIARTDLYLERKAQEKMLGVYEKRRQIAKAIPKFWPVALMNNSMFAMHSQHNADQMALSYLEDLWIVRDPVETRCFTLEFYFKENPYFSNRVLKKEYKYVPPPAASTDKADEDGITEAMLEFSWERDVDPQAFKIDWKDGSKNLDQADGGSIFNYFECAEDHFDIGVLIANDVFPDAIDYFLGQVPDDDELGDETDEDDEDEDEDEIDLEKPRPKKPRQK
ncbi:hypothetical protein QCA50_001500 [Cerrena zonata]|uniref:Template-activating factor I n=1 Tax=Cerrena zonata TaxID=2478898 RepID=A0AAW0GL56_9APHY